MSNINPNNIDTAYPVAGIDNDSQGFRDNFTNIRNNFRFAKSEIEDLVANVVVKKPLRGEPLNNDLSGNEIKSVTISDFRKKLVSLPGGGTVTINHKTANYYAIETNSNPTQINLTGWPTPIPQTASAPEVPQAAGSVVLEVKASPGHRINFGTALVVGLESIEGSDGNSITFNSAGKRLFEIISTNGGNEYLIYELTKSYNKTKSLSTSSSVSSSPVELSMANVLQGTYRFESELFIEVGSVANPPTITLTIDLPASTNSKLVVNSFATPQLDGGLNNHLIFGSSIPAALPIGTTEQNLPQQICVRVQGVIVLASPGPVGISLSKQDNATDNFTVVEGSYIQLSKIN